MVLPLQTDLHLSGGDEQRFSSSAEGFLLARSRCSAIKALRAAYTVLLHLKHAREIKYSLSLMEHGPFFGVGCVSVLQCFVLHKVWIGNSCPCKWFRVIFLGV